MVMNMNVYNTESVMLKVDNGPDSLNLFGFALDSFIDIHTDMLKDHLQLDSANAETVNRESSMTDKNIGPSLSALLFSVTGFYDE
ncbi:hypothetical protein PGN76_19695 [Klebsiella aerogenes]|uniref:hypothetical protein n=1 Tax=Klebsiella aerogenes TaxID=548 RepID=UPI001F177320|nr:hypothetical protein [Klebsiella aerogenes]HDU4640178.1 hypothetical protein [Klebsiella aerogenes]